MEKKYIEDKITIITIPEVVNSLLVLWEKTGRNPTRQSVMLKMAHIHLETGMKSCHCHNLGNIKSHPQDGYAYTTFGCGEEVLLNVAQQMVASDPTHVTIKSQYVRGGKDMASIWITPPHEWTRFAAFETLDEGVMSQFKYLLRHPLALEALMTGDPLKYSQALQKEKYFTADPNRYASVLVQRKKIVENALKNYNWGDVV